MADDDNIYLKPFVEKSGGDGIEHRQSGVSEELIAIYRALFQKYCAVLVKTY